MSGNVSAKKALNDLSIIKQTIDRSIGADFFIDLYYSLGLLMSAFGLMIVAGSGATWYLLKYNVLAPHTVKLIIGIWVSLFVCGGIVKVKIFMERSKKHGMDFWSYIGKVSGKTFFDADLPLELAGAILIAFFIKIGHWDYVLPTISLTFGVSMSSLGTLFIERSFKRWGYFYICLGGVGYFLLSQEPLLFLSIMGGSFVIWGIFMKRRSKELESEGFLNVKADQTGA